MEQREYPNTLLTISLFSFGIGGLPPPDLNILTPATGKPPSAPKVVIEHDWIITVLGSQRGEWPLNN